MPTKTTTNITGNITNTSLLFLLPRRGMGKPQSGTRLESILVSARSQTTTKFQTETPPEYHRVLHAVCNWFSTIYPWTCQQDEAWRYGARFSARAIHSPKQRPMIAQDHARGVVSGGAGDAAAGMGAASAMIKALQRP